MKKYEIKLGMYKHDDNDQLDNAAYKNSWWFSWQINCGWKTRQKETNFFC